MTERRWLLFRDNPANEIIGLYSNPAKAITKALEIDPDEVPYVDGDEFRVGKLSRVISMEVE